MTTLERVTEILNEASDEMYHEADLVSRFLDDSLMLMATMHDIENEFDCVLEPDPIMTVAELAAMVDDATGVSAG